MNIPLSPPLAAVTGASSGLGRAVSVALARRSGTVIALGRREMELLITARQAGRGVLPLAGDITTPALRTSLVRRCRELGPLQFLVHGAGIHPIEPFDGMTAEAWRETMATNVEARLWLTRELLPCLAPGARVLFLGSRSATRARIGGTAYCVAQAASFMLHECLKAELAPRGVFVGSAIPSPTLTPMVEAQLAADPAAYPDAADYRQLAAAGRFIAPETTARFLVWLLMDTTADEFTAKEWRITDESHHARWLGTNPLTAPAPARDAADGAACR